MGCCADECELLLPAQDPGLQLYYVLSAVDDDTGEAVDFTDETMTLVFDPQNDDADRVELEGTVSDDGLSVVFDGDDDWTADNLTPGLFYEVRLVDGVSPSRRRVGPVMGLQTNYPAKGVM